MGLHLRKNFGKSFSVNISRSGIGYSVGGKEIRYTKKANGGSRLTISVPKTGISYHAESSRNKSKKIKYSNSPKLNLSWQ